MQLQPMPGVVGAKGAHGVRPYAGLVDAVRMIVAEEGALGLYKGAYPRLKRMDR